MLHTDSPDIERVEDETEAETREIEAETRRGSMREFHLDVKKPTHAQNGHAHAHREGADLDHDAHTHAHTEDKRSARDSVHEVVIQRAASPTRDDDMPLDVKMAERKRQVRLLLLGSQSWCLHFIAIVLCCVVVMACVLCVSGQSKVVSCGFRAAVRNWSWRIRKGASSTSFLLLSSRNWNMMCSS